MSVLPVSGPALGRIACRLGNLSTISLEVQVQYFSVLSAHVISGVAI